MVTFTGQTTVATIPSYGTWKPYNKATYANGLLGLTYGDIASKRTFLQVFDMSNFNWDKPLTTPLYMFAGYYQEVNTGSPFLEEVPYFIHESPPNNGFPNTFALTIDPSGGVTKIGV